MPAVECIDRGGEARGLSGKSRESEMASATVHELGKRRAGVTRWILAVEDHISARWFESLDPSAEWRRTIEKGGTAELAEKCHRKAVRSRVGERDAAVREREIGVRQGHKAGTGDIFLL